MQIIFIRHGEKSREHESIHLNHTGKVRAKYLVDYFLHPSNDFSKPGFVFMMNMSKQGKSERCWETMQPTIAQGGLEYELVERYNTHKLAAYLSKECNKNDTIVVCWQHSRIVDMLNLLGAKQVNAWGFDPESGHDDGQCFDATWVVNLDKHHLHLKVFSQFCVVDDVPVYERDRDTVFFEQTYRHVRV